MIDLDFIWEFAFTEDDTILGYDLALLITYFITAYDEEKVRFAKDNGIELTDYELDEFRENYILYLYDMLLNVRLNIQEKQRELHEMQVEEEYEKLRDFITTYFALVHMTEIQVLVQSASLNVVKELRRNNADVIIEKRWKAFPGCCPICKALDGVTIPVDEPFLVNGQVVEDAHGKLHTYSYVDRYICVAHPNDRCMIEYIITQ